MLHRLRDHGNSVPVVVEHDRGVTRAADWIVDVGRRAGELLFYGRLDALLLSDTATSTCATSGSGHPRPR